ncbi:hypothetical protein [Simkania sp.]|uniref:hypothetical protein n=1 Tax=Simkania sp. TaxID=34094 RepID=UPI003B526D81
MNDPQALSHLLAESPLWGQSESPIWLSSRFTLKRNLASFPFSPKINETEEQQLLSLLEPTLSKTSLLKEGFLFRETELSTTLKEGLAEHFLLEGDAKSYLIDPSGFFLVRVEGDEHLTLTCLEPASSWKSKWENLSSFERAVGETYEFAFSPKFGYLSSDPTCCGTALSVEAILHIPCLIHLEELDEVLAKTLPDEVTSHGLGGGDDYIGDFITLKNQFTLGVSEDHILDSVHKAGAELMKLEASRREKLKLEKDAFMRDKISRAYGLLLHSFQIETKEAFAALSLLKLGIDLEWVAGMRDQEISAIFFRCSRAHLALDSQEPLTPEQLAEKRADYLKQQCNKLKLKI